MRIIPYLSNLDYGKRILEIGPLAKPLVPKDKGPFVFYADIRSTEEIKRFYAGDTDVDYATIQEIDFVVTNTYQAALIDQGVEQFDYVLGSHVIEHIPLLLRFFSDIGTILREGGRLCLSVPDHRYCFDHFRVPTSFAEAYDVHMHGLQRLAPRVLDFCMNTSHNNASEYWRNESTLQQLENKSFESAKRYYERALSGEYIDVHFSVFTPTSFLRLLFDTIRANMLPFRTVGIHITLPDTLEFHIVLEKNEKMLDQEDLRHRELQKLTAIIEHVMQSETKIRQAVSQCISPVGAS